MTEKLIKDPRVLGNLLQSDSVEELLRDLFSKAKLVVSFSKSPALGSAVPEIFLREVAMSAVLDK